MVAGAQHRCGLSAWNCQVTQIFLKTLKSSLNFSSVIITFYRQHKQNTVSLLLTHFTFHPLDLNFFDWYWLIGSSAGASGWQVSSKPGCVCRPCGSFLPRLQCLCWTDVLSQNSAGNIMLLLKLLYCCKVWCLMMESLFFSAVLMFTISQV